MIAARANKSNSVVMHKKLRKENLQLKKKLKKDPQQHIKLKLVIFQKYY